MRPVRLGILVTLTASLITAAQPARADWTVGVDLALTFPVGEPETHVGWVAAGQGGYRFHAAGLSFGPEIGGGYGIYTPVASAQKGTGFFFGGGRLGLDFVPIVTPYAVARLGYGVANTSNLPDPNQTSTFSAGAFIDAVLGVSRKITPNLEVGLEGGYSTIEPGHCFCARWVHAGAAGTLIF